MEVRRLSAGDGALLRGVRLRALADAPYAFSSWYEREAAYDDELWEIRAAPRGRGAVFVALESGEALGMAGGYYRAPEDEIPELWGMWVDPGARRRGAARALVEAVASWARESGARRLRAAVTDADISRPAAELYRTLGFVGSGEREPLRSDGSLEAIVMYRDL